MPVKETNPNGLDIGREGKGTRIPQFEALVRGDEATAIELFTDDALDSIGKAIARNLIIDARNKRKVK